MPRMNRYDTYSLRHRKQNNKRFEEDQREIRTHQTTEKKVVPDVFPFVLFGNDHVTAVGLQVVHLDGPVRVVLHRERRVDDATRVVLPAKQKKKDAHIGNRFQRRRLSFKNENESKKKEEQLQH